MFAPTTTNPSKPKVSARTRPDSEEMASWMQQPISANSAWVPVAPPRNSDTATSTTKFRIEPAPRDTTTKSRSNRSTHSREKRPPSDVPRPDVVSSQSHRTVSTSTMTSSSESEGISSNSGSTSGKSSSRHPLSKPRPDREDRVKEKSSGRGRSSSRSRHSISTSQPKEPSASSKTARGRSLEKSRSKSKTPPKSDIRGGSKEPAGRDLSKERISRGVSMERSSRVAPRAPAEATSKVRDRSRPPVTRSGREGRSRTRSRSRSLNRDGQVRPRSRSRSASLTRVTNPAHGPASPGVKSTGRIGFERSSRPPIVSRPRVKPDTPRSGRYGSHPDDGSIDGRIGRDISIAKPTSSNASIASNSSRRTRSGLLGKLFGDGGHTSRGGIALDQVRPRILLAATVYHNTATGLWITTINTNQRGVAKNPKLANKYLKAFSFPSEHEARESAIANAPPKMVSFHESPKCHICDGSFAVFRRASHCRNCGVCICKECSVTWSCKMIPDTYNLKKEALVRVCVSCDTLTRGFRTALLEGDYEEAIALYGTGNINLRTPFPVNNKKEEVMYPVHCAVEGGNIEIVRWLVDVHFCPIKKVQASTKKARRGAPESLIITSRNRHVLSIAIQRLQVDMIRYLVVDCGVSIHESTDLESSLRALEATLMRLPRTISNVPRPEGEAEPRWDNASFDEISEPSTLSGERSLYEDAGTVGSKVSSKTKGDACIICFDRKINCVCTPCGHQVCCLECSSNMKACPVCNNRGDFIKIFRP